MFNKLFSCKKAILSVFIFIITNPVYAQFINGTEFTAMGNASVALQNIWSNNANAAGLTNLTSSTFAVAYENSFLVKELNSKSAVAAIPVKNYVIGASFQSYGITEYATSKVSGSVAKKFGHKLSAAITLNYHQLNIDNYGNAKAFSAEAGIQYEAFPKLRIGAHIANPNQGGYTHRTGQTIQSHIKFGASYLFSDKLTAASEIEKVTDAQIDFKLGISYQIIEYLSLRGGISVNTFRQYGGFGLNYQKLNIGFAVSSHPVLGYSPQIALGYEF